MVRRGTLNGRPLVAWPSKTPADLNALLPEADFVALICPLTAETEKLIGANALARRQIRGAAALPAASPLWSMENVLITPHTAGETCSY